MPGKTIEKSCKNHADFYSSHSYGCVFAMHFRQGAQTERKPQVLRAMSGRYAKTCMAVYFPSVEIFMFLL